MCSHTQTFFCVWLCLFVVLGQSSICIWHLQLFWLSVAVCCDHWLCRLSHLPEAVFVCARVCVCAWPTAAVPPLWLPMYMFLNPTGTCRIKSKFEKKNLPVELPIHKVCMRRNAFVWWREGSRERGRVGKGEWEGEGESAWCVFTCWQKSVDFSMYPCTSASVGVLMNVEKFTLTMSLKVTVDPRKLWLANKTFDCVHLL